MTGENDEGGIHVPLVWSPVEGAQRPWALSLPAAPLAPSLFVFPLSPPSFLPASPSKFLLFWACSSSPPFLKASLVVLWVLREGRKLTFMDH